MRRPIERARRRADQLRARGEVVDIEMVQHQIMDRDSRDARRAVGPLAIPRDAEMIDTTELPLRSVVDQIVAKARQLQRGPVPLMNQRSFVWKSLQIIARLGTTLMFDLKTYGDENVPKDGGVLLVANHQSYLDPVLVAVHLSRPVSFLAKSELFENPHFGWFIRMLHAFPVRQGEGDIGAVKEIIRRLGEGHALNIYPEGSRTETGEIGRLEKGVALVIRRARGAGCAGGDRRIVRGVAEG
jgi:1-acyl-sn-glycerol-3-phosphate acyltransferase